MKSISTYFASAVLPIMGVAALAAISIAHPSGLGYFLPPILVPWTWAWHHLSKHSEAIPLFEGKRIQVSTAWYDLWVGTFVDTKKRRLYICPIPCFLITISF